MKIIRKIAPILLIPLLLLASVGFTLDIHYCGDEVKNIGLFKATPCEMESEMNQVADFSILPPCHQKMLLANKSAKNGFNQSKCCHNESFNFESSSELQSSATHSMNIDDVRAILVFTAIHFGFLTPITDYKAYRNYRPPLIDQDFSVLHQVFRI